MTVAQLRKNNVPYYLWELAKKRADVRNGVVAFDLCVGDIEVPSECSITNRAFRRGSDGQKSPYSPVLWRVDSSVGYIAGNICVVSWVAAQYLARLPEASYVNGTLLEPHPLPDYPWKLVCTHGRGFYCPDRAAALRFQKRPEHWCVKCRREAKKRTHVV